MNISSSGSPQTSSLSGPLWSLEDGGILQGSWLSLEVQCWVPPTDDDQAPFSSEVLPQEAAGRREWLSEISSFFLEAGVWWAGNGRILSILKESFRFSLLLGISREIFLVSLNPLTAKHCFLLCKLESWVW